MSNISPSPLNASQERLLLGNMALVRSIAQRYANTTMACREDLIQVGLVGLVQAARRYRRSSGVPFTSFARPHVRGAMLHYLRDQLHLVRLPRRQHERRHQWMTGGGTASISNLERATLQQWSALSSPLPLDELEDQENGNWQMLTGGDRPDALTSGSQAYQPTLLNAQWHDAPIEQLLALVDQRKRQVLRRVVLQGWSYRRTANAMGISAPTVQRLLHGALQELRNRLSQANVSAPGPSSRRARSVAATC